MIEKPIKLYLGTHDETIAARVSCGDTMWRFIFSVIMNGQKWAFPDGARAVFNGKKADNNVFSFPCEITENNNAVVDCDEQVTPVPGPVECELSISAGGKVVGTANFVIYVEQAPKSPDDISSESTLPAYAELLETAAKIPDNLPGYITDWLDENITQPTTPAVDKSLTVSGAAADAKVVGDDFAKTLMQRDVLANGQDMDTLTNAGVYRKTQSATVTNAPEAKGQSAEVVVIQGNTGYGVVQVWVDVNNNTVYTRTKLSPSAAWSAWAQLDATDPTLTVSGMAADAKVVGDDFARTMIYRGALPSGLAEGQTLDDLTQTGFYYASTISAEQASSINWPVPGSGGRLVVYGNTSGASNVVQVAYINNSARDVVMRSTTSGGTWSGWKKFAMTAL